MELRQRQSSRRELRQRLCPDSDDDDKELTTEDKCPPKVQEQTTERSARSEPQPQRPPTPQSQRPTTQTGKQPPKPAQQKQPSLVYAQGAMTTSAIIALSFIYAWTHASQRITEMPNSPVSKYLDLMALQHVGIVVANLSRSTTFYTEVLGGAEVSLGPETLPMIALGKPSAPTRWRAVNFGSVIVVLWEAIQNSPVITDQPQLAFRLREAINMTEFGDILRGRLASFDDFSSTHCSEQSVLAPDWDIVVCKGPDNEAVQFWRVRSKTLVQKFENTRRAWSQVASDSRARDLFE